MVCRHPPEATRRRSRPDTHASAAASSLEPREWPPPKNRWHAPAVPPADARRAHRQPPRSVSRLVPLARRNPSPSSVATTDRTAQHVSLGFGQRPEKPTLPFYGIKGAARTNAPSPTAFFATLKKELVHR